jgi:carbon monoxide dehydrogenase subunit G
MAWQSITPSGACSWRIKHNALVKCSYSGPVAEPPDRVWSSLSDIDRTLADLRDATLARDGDAVTGSVKCAVGASQVTYRISARLDGRASGHRAVIVVDGKEARGDGTLAARLDVSVCAAGSGSTVEIAGEVDVTGRGASGDAATWSRILGRMASGPLALAPASTVVAAASAPAAEPAAPRPALSVAAPARDRTPDERSLVALVNPKAIASIVFGLLVLLRRRRRRRTEGVE